MLDMSIGKLQGSNLSLAPFYEDREEAISNAVSVSRD